MVDQIPIMFDCNNWCREAQRKQGKAYHRGESYTSLREKTTKKAVEFFEKLSEEENFKLVHSS